VIVTTAKAIYFSDEFLLDQLKLEDGLLDATVLDRVSELTVFENDVLNSVVGVVFVNSRGQYLWMDPESFTPTKLLEIGSVSSFLDVEAKMLRRALALSVTSWKNQLRKEFPLLKNIDHQNDLFRLYFLNSIAVEDSDEQEITEATSLLGNALAVISYTRIGDINVSFPKPGVYEGSDPSGGQVLLDTLWFELEEPPYDLDAWLYYPND